MENILYNDFYTDKINHITLREALDYHYKLNPQFTKWDKYPSLLQQQTMKSHDLFHILFGCDTSLSGEFRVELFTLFGIDLSFKEYLKLVSNSDINKEPFDIVKKIGVWKVIGVMIYHIWYIPYCWYRGSHLKKKIPAFDVDSLMGKTVGQIRDEYGIKL